LFNDLNDGISFPGKDGDFFSTTSTEQATELPTSYPMCCKDSSVEDDATDREADNLL
jgi:hypothetical protein